MEKDHRPPLTEWERARLQERERMIRKAHELGFPGSPSSLSRLIRAYEKLRDREPFMSWGSYLDVTGALAVRRVMRKGGHDATT